MKLDRGVGTRLIASSNVEAASADTINRDPPTSKRPARTRLIASSNVEAASADAINRVPTNRGAYGILEATSHHA